MAYAKQLKIGTEYYDLDAEKLDGHTYTEIENKIALTNGTLNTSVLPSTLTVNNVNRTFVRKHGNIVWLSLHLDNTGTVAVTVASLIPDGYRPKQLIYGQLIDPTNAILIPIYISSDGSIRFYLTQQVTSITGTIVYFTD